MYQIEKNKTNIDIRGMFFSLYRYKWMMIFLTLFVALGSFYYAYFKENIYQANVLVEVGTKVAHYSDKTDMNIENVNVDIATEIRILKSRSLVNKALESVNLVQQFFIEKRYKTVEVYYQDVPFEVGLLKGYGFKFTLFPINETQYRLVVNENDWHYDKTHLYGEEIKTEHFQINIVRKNNQHIKQKYQFIFRNPHKLAQLVLKNLTVVREMQSNILSLSYADTLSIRAKKFINALANAYIKQSMEYKIQKMTQKLDYIDVQMKKISENLRNSAVKLEDFKKNSKRVNLSSKSENILKQMNTYEIKLTQITMQEEMLNIVYSVVKKGKNLESMSFAGLGVGETSLSKLIEELQKSVLERKFLREDYTNMHPAVRKVSNRIRQIKQLLTSLIKNLRKNIKDKKHLLELSLEEKQIMLDKLPIDDRRYGQLQRKFLVNEKIYSYLLEKHAETAMLIAAIVSKNRIIDLAILSDNAIAPNRNLIVLLGVLLGFIFSLILSLFRMYLDDTLKSEDDIYKQTNIPILGVIPHVKDLEDNVKVYESPKSAIAEAFRNLRTNLQFIAKDRRNNIIAITSTVASEGKTTVSVNLGAILSMSGKKTIIVNLDMRKPTLHKRFNLELGEGISSLLAEKTTLSDVIQKTKYKNLDIISSGPIPPNPSELVQSELMLKILEKLKEVYEVIILDTPPVGLVTDARILMDYADTSIYIFRANYSKKEYLNNLKRMSQYTSLHGISIVLNDVKSSVHGYGYYEETEK